MSRKAENTWNYNTLSYYPIITYHSNSYTLITLYFSYTAYFLLYPCKYTFSDRTTLLQRAIILFNSFQLFSRSSQKLVPLPDLHWIFNVYSNYRTTLCSQCIWSDLNVSDLNVNDTHMIQKQRKALKIQCVSYISKYNRGGSIRTGNGSRQAGRSPYPEKTEIFPKPNQILPYPAYPFKSMNKTITKSRGNTLGSAYLCKIGAKRTKKAYNYVIEGWNEVIDL